MTRARDVVVGAIFLVFSVSGPALADELPPPSPLSLTFEGGYRYVVSGLDHTGRGAEEARFHGGAFEGGVTMHAGNAARGFYGAGRFDLYYPTASSGGIVFATEARVGLFHHVQHYDDGYRTFVSGGTRCWSALGVCYTDVTSTTRQVAPPRWWRSIEYYWVGYRAVGGLPARVTSRGETTSEVMHAITGGAGVQTPGRGIARGRFEVDVQRYLNAVSGQNPWGLRLRGGVTAGPVYLDASVLLDDAIGGELAIGAGVILRTR